MKLDASFRIFNQRIVPNDVEVKNLKDAYEELKTNLSKHEKESDFGELIIKNFMQGSLKRKTCLKIRGEKYTDVDIVLVTKMHEDEFKPVDAHNKFFDFVEKYYQGKHEPKGRCIGLKLKDIKVDIDLVITSNPTEAQLGFIDEELLQEYEDVDRWDEKKLAKSMDGFRSIANLDGLVTLSESAPERWDIEPLRIPDRDAKEWQDTNPIAQIYWTIRKNEICNGNFLHVVRAIKWMRESFGGFPEYPKGYPLEHMVGDCCPNGIASIADGILGTLEEMVRRYQPFVQQGAVPYLKDRGVDADVLSRQKPEHFELFYSRIKEAALLARNAWSADEAHQSSLLWRQLFGDEFPLSAPPLDGAKKFVSPTSTPDSEKRRFA